MPESEMATASRMLAQGVQEKGVEVRTFMPKYGFINERRNQLHEVIRLSGMNLIIDDTDHPLVIKVATLQPARLQVYFIYNEDYFIPPTPSGEAYDTVKRERVKDLEINTHVDDNDERSIFYVRGVLETVKKLRWIPDIIHCQGWMSAVVPLYIKTAYHDEPSFANTKVVTSIFGHKLTSELNEDFKRSIEFRDAKREMLDKYNEKFDFPELAKLAIDYSDGIVEAVDNVNPELMAYAEAGGKKLLRHADIGNLGDSLDQFYDLVMES